METLTRWLESGGSSVGQAMTCCTILKCWTLVLAIVGIGEKVHLKRLVEQPAPLEVGSTEDGVLAALGQPRIKWDARRGFIFGRHPPQWIYGTTIDLRAMIIPELPFPNPLPIKIRLFSPDEDDLVIEWTPERKVSAVKRPNVDVPNAVARLYEPVYFFADLARAVAQRNND